MEQICSMKTDRIRRVQETVRALLRARGLSVSDLARRTGRAREDVRRSLRANHAWRLDRLYDYAAALGVPPAALLSEPDFSVLARHARWDDRRASRRVRTRRLRGPDRFREVARILEGVPMERYWKDLDLDLLYLWYPFVRPHLSRTQPLWDAILPVLASRPRPETTGPGTNGRPARAPARGRRSCRRA